MVANNYFSLLIDKLTSKIKRERFTGEVVKDVLEWLNYTTFDIIGEFLWGSSFAFREGV